jgi:hypothetical protein
MVQLPLGGAVSHNETRGRISEAQSPVVQNCGGGATYRRQVSAEILERAEVRVGDNRLGGALVLRAELLLRLAVAEVALSFGNAAANKLCSGGARRGGGAGMLW